MTVGKFERVQDWMFRQVHEKQLVYNTCWEDPRCDRQLLEMGPESDVVMITSAGCNALDYLLDKPRRIHCVDVNPRQNALLHLKQAVFNRGSHDDLFKLFGQGKHAWLKTLYRKSLRPVLPLESRPFWDANLHYFNSIGLRRSFYHYGSSGTFAWLFGQYLRARPGLYAKVVRMFEAESMSNQVKVYDEIEKKVLSPFLRWLVNRHLTMCLVGVPRSQQLLFRDDYQEGTLGFIQECLRKVFTRLPLKDNYFWRVYLHGTYTPTCCPSYLKRAHFEELKNECHRLETHTNTITGFLKENPGQYSHFVLLDHQDWLAANDRAGLHEEWEQILANSRPGTRILLRSAAREIDFFPDFVRDRVEFQTDKCNESHHIDRVGTYASVYLGIVT